MANAPGILSGGGYCKPGTNSSKVTGLYGRISEYLKDEGALIFQTDDFSCQNFRARGLIYLRKKQCTLPGMGESWAEQRGPKREKQMFWDYIQAARKMGRCLAAVEWETRGRKRAI